MVKPKPIPQPLSSQDIARFWSKVDKTPGHGPNGDCWIWTASLFKDRKGHSIRYGRFTFKGKNFLAHRVGFLIATGEDPIDTLILHRCDVMQCVNIKHLFKGTYEDNMADKIAKGRQSRGDHRKPEHIRRGERNHKAKLSAQDVITMRDMFKRGVRISPIAKQFRVTYQTAWRAVLYLNWKHIY